MPTVVKKKKIRRTPKAALSAMTYQLAKQMQGSDLAAQYTHIVENMRVRQGLEAGTRARNLQIQYGKILESLNRLPVAFQADAIVRLKELERQLTDLRSKYPLNFPRGPMPGQREAELRRRLIE